MSFKNTSPSKTLFKNDISNEHISDILGINPSLTDWVQNVPRLEFS